MADDVAVRVENLHFTYGKARESKDRNSKDRNSDRNSTEALRGISFVAPRAKITGILGPNGSGKSTTFKILSTQLQPSQGTATVAGASLKTELDKVRSKLGVTFQSPSLDPMLTVLENLQIQTSLLGFPAEKAVERIDELLAFFNLTDRSGDRVKTLSGGLARRVELAKAILNKPEVLLLDEPTTGLDPKLRKQFWEELRRLCEQGTTLLVTTHLMDEADLCDQIIFLTEGKVAAAGAPHELKEAFGGDVLVLEDLQAGPQAQLLISEDWLSANLKSLAKWSVAEGKLRLETRQPTQVLTLLLGEFGDKIRNLHWDKPNLGDVYFSKTGQAL